jgi:hypothetical protein
VGELAIGHLRARAIQLEQLRELDFLLEYLNGRQLDILLAGQSRLEWWLEDSQRMKDLIYTIKQIRDEYHR